MDHDAFQTWRKAQARVTELEQLLQMADNTLSASQVPETAADLREQLAQAQREADAALAECLRESGRNRRVHRLIGLHSRVSDSRRSR